ncbi:MAG: hypothetical protein U9N54_12870 [candidate division Zixibacteria bacterium]|nr:hypothetical protein [candidate division Zixibacteria bacterium]
MIKKSKSFYFLLSLLIFSFVFSSCGIDKQGDPKKTVISMFGAMEKNDKAALVAYLDLPELMKNISEDYAFHSDDEPRVFDSPQQILEDLTEGGLTKRRWFSYQRIIGNVENFGETATVEVSFIDNENSKGYLSKFGLHKVNGKWKIYSFKAIPNTD